MSNTIKDGSGNGYLAGVTPTNRLKTSSRSNPRIYYISRDYKKAFSVCLNLTQKTGGESEGVGYIKYLGNYKLNIKRISFSTNDVDNTIFTIWKNPIVSGGELINPTNLNFNSNSEIFSECVHENNSGNDVNITNGKEISTIGAYGPETFILECDDSIILSYNNIIGITAKSANTSSNIFVNIWFYEENF